MPSIDSDAAWEEIVPGKSWLVLHSYWESWKQDDGKLGFASVLIEKGTNVDTPEEVEYEEVFYEEVPELRDGEFGMQDIRDRYGAKFYEILAQERRKLGLREAPIMPGKGRGWHGESGRHRAAALKGKGLYPIPRTAKWQASMAVTKAMEQMKKRGHDIRHV